MNGFDHVRYVAHCRKLPFREAVKTKTSGELDGAGVFRQAYGNLRTKLLTARIV